MKWIKKRLIIHPGHADWMITHAMCPFAYRVNDDTCRIYFTGRDAQGRGRTGFAEINTDNPEKILRITDTPVFDIGDIGCFDDCGVVATSLVEYNNTLYLYYGGYTHTKTVSITAAIGLAISTDGGNTFTRHSCAPIFDRSEHDPYFLTSPWVIVEEGLFRMWYTSGLAWKVENPASKPKHYYHITYAESKDGIRWTPSGKACIAHRENEYAIARPVVYKEGDICKMWYSYRGGNDTYRIGYAESSDGLDWNRKDSQTGIDISDSGWDSEMICYPFILKNNDTRYMFYNGNGYGKTGCGYAVLSE